MGAKLSIGANTAGIDSDVLSAYPHQLFVKVLLNRKRSVVAHLKTCSTYNFIHPIVAEELGLILIPANKEVKSLTAQVTRYNMKCKVNMKLLGSSLELNDVECVLRHHSDPIQPQMTLSHDFFRRFASVSLIYGGGLGNAIAYHYDNISVIDVIINKVKVERVHIYSAQNQSLMGVEFAKRLKLPLCHEMDGSTAHPVFGSGKICLVNMLVSGSEHHQFKFKVVDNLHMDLFLGADFLSKHCKVKIIYGGKVPGLRIRHERKIANRSAQQFEDMNL